MIIYIYIFLYVRNQSNMAMDHSYILYQMVGKYKTNL